MILNATSEYRVVFLYLFGITTIFQTNVLFKKNKCHVSSRETPLERRARGNCPRCPPFNPALGDWVLYDNTHQGLLGSCVKFCQTAVVALKIHFETKKELQKSENLSFVHSIVRWSCGITLLSADCCLPQQRKVCESIKNWFQ